jgi:DegV family protein with EDD domain
MSSIGIITDSTAYIPEKFIKQFNIIVLPQILIWGDETYRDGVDIQPSAFYNRLQSATVMPSTSQVTPAAFTEAYERLIGEGKEVLAILLSAKLSGTIDSAVQAKAMTPDAKIHIFDSNTTTMALGFQVLSAARAIQDGAEIEQVLKMLEDGRDHTGVYLTPATLEFLHRGGRIGNASRFLGTALNIKPILGVIDGRVEPVERVRTHRKALQRLVEIIQEKAGQHAVRIACLHANAPGEAEEVLKLCESQLDVQEGFVGDVSPVIGTHVGPGTVAIAYQVIP